MSYHLFRSRHALSLLVLTAAFWTASPTLADDLTDVNQLVRAGRMAEALAKVDQSLASRPRDPQMRFLRGVILTETGRTTEAIAVFTRLTEDYPELPEPYNNLAVLHAGQNQFDKARAALEMAIRTNPSYATAHENLGDVYARLASQAYSRALQLDAGNANLQPKLALIRELFSQPRPPAQRPPASAAVPVSPPASAARSASPAAPAAPNAATGSQAPKLPPAAPAVAAGSAPSPAPAPAPVPAPPPVAAATPAAQAPAAAPAAPAAASATNTSQDIEAAVRAWAAAWSAKDMKAYLAAYADDFDPPGEQSRKNWEEERRVRIVGKARISVRLSDLQIQAQGNKAVVRFRQAYSADNLNVSSRKTLEMRKAGERWLIVRESTGG